MELTTKELFDLAETHWAETNPMTAPWDRVSPMGQARQAEAIKAVIAEYEKIRVNDYLSTIPIKDSWDNWEDVPVGVIVEGHGPSTTCKDGTKHNKFRKRADGGVDFWATFDKDPTVLSESEPYEGSSPFVKVENTKGPWDRWEDVPDGVRYSPAGRPEYMYVNRSGLRRVIGSNESEITSVATDNTVQSWGPFKKAEQ